MYLRDSENRTSAPKAQDKHHKYRDMKISRIEHLGIAVKSIEEALPYYEQVLGFECYNIETVEDQKVRTAFLKVGETKIELLEATSPESTIAKFIENRGEGIHHIAYKVTWWTVVHGVTKSQT